MRWKKVDDTKDSKKEKASFYLIETQPKEDFDKTKVVVAIVTLVIVLTIVISTIVIILAINEKRKEQ